jgi:hypothetical protein
MSESKLILPDHLKTKEADPKEAKPGEVAVAQVEKMDGTKEEIPYFAIEVRTYTDTLHHQIIQRVVVLGTPPPSFCEFQGIGNYEFPIPKTGDPAKNIPARMHPFEHPINIPAKTIQEAFGMFNECEHKGTAEAYEKFKEWAQAKLDEQLARFRAQQEQQQRAELQQHKQLRAAAKTAPKKNGRR